MNTPVKKSQTQEKMRHNKFRRHKISKTKKKRRKRRRNHKT